MSALDAILSTADIPFLQRLAHEIGRKHYRAIISVICIHPGRDR